MSFSDLHTPCTIQPSGFRLVTLSTNFQQRRLEVLGYIRAHPDTTCAKIVQYLGYHQGTIENDLGTLKRLSKIVSSGKNPTKWRVME